ncbi:MAG: ATP-binding cassette domain-containing protein, partial [Clostridiales bacterium]
MLAVKATDLTKKYGRYYGIDNVNISVETGDVFGIVGPKGAGKTTLLRLLMNYIFPSAGSGSIYGNDIVANAAIIKETTGYVPTEVTCYPQMKAGKYIKTAMKMHGVRNNAAMVKLIDKFDVPRNQTFEVMDRVDAKTTGIVAALAIKPKVLLLDEPTKGLDSSYRSILFDLLIEEHEKGTTILITAETIEELAGFCNRIAIIKEGSVVEVKEYDGDVYVDETAVTDFTDEFSDYEEIEETEEKNPLEDTIPLNIEENPVLSSDLDADKSDAQNDDLNGVDLGVAPISSPTATTALNQVPMAAAAVENLPVKEEPKYVEASIEDFLAEPEIIEEKPTEDFLAETEIITENPSEKSAENNGEIAAPTEPITEEKPSLLNTDLNEELNTDVPQDENSPTMAAEEFSAENKETPKPTTEVKETADTANEPVANNSETVINNTELADNKPQSGS